MKFNFKELNPKSVKITAQEFAVEDLETDKIYLTSKPYMDKLFKILGYRSTNVVKILKEYADKTIDQITGEFKEYGIYADEVTDSFIVVKKTAMENYQKLLNRLDSKIISTMKYDPYYTWDQFKIKNDFNNQFYLYASLSYEKVYLLSTCYDQDGLSGIYREGNSYDLNEAEDLLDLDSLISTENACNIDSEFTYDSKISIYEYIKLLESLELVTKKKRRYIVNEEGYKIPECAGSVEAIVDDYNSMSELRSHITEVPGFTFRDAVKVVESMEDHVMIWNSLKFFEENYKMISDFFQLS